MKVLFLTASEEDYLADSLLLGLREILGPNVVDYPRKDILYSDASPLSLDKIRGKGFSYYTGLLSPEPINRSHVPQRLSEGEFDFVVFSDVWRTYGYLIQWHKYLNSSSLVFVDGQDTDVIFPYHGTFVRNKSYFALDKKRIRNSLYFKRELTERSGPSWLFRLMPSSFCAAIWPSDSISISSINFGFPSQKILSCVPPKKKRFVSHIVDLEVAENLSVSTGYQFLNEESYFDDLQASEFGITTKRAGWDCLRHYEIAANGCVPCFRDLNLKPPRCAPHGLNSINSISYSSFDDLLTKIRLLNPSSYERLAENALSWARHNSCNAVASRFLNRLGNHSIKS